jgi:hypothetical protein
VRLARRGGGSTFRVGDGLTSFVGDALSDLKGTGDGIGDGSESLGECGDGVASAAPGSGVPLPCNSLLLDERMSCGVRIDAGMDFSFFRLFGFADSDRNFLVPAAAAVVVVAADRGDCRSLM